MTKRKECAAEASLNDKGIETYLPMLDESPLFDGYLFAKLTDLEIIQRSRMMYLPEFHHVPDTLVNEFRDTDWQRSEACTEGSLVRVTQGPFTYMSAIVKTKKADRIIVLMNIIQGQKPQELEFRLNEVEAA